MVPSPRCLRLAILTLLFPLAAAAHAPLLAQCNSYDLTAYFVPNYSGWDTAKRIWIDSNNITSPASRWYSYAPSKYAYIKFGDPHSVETYTYDSYFIYITAENYINNQPVSRVWPGGLSWLPRYGFKCTGCTSQENLACLNLNLFDPCYTAQNHFDANCQFTSGDPQHCNLNPSNVYLTSYNYGYSIGTLASVVKNDRNDVGGGWETYYYGLGRGFLRFEVHDGNNNLTYWAQQTGETPNQPLADQACFHP